MKLRFEVAGTTDLEPLYELNKSLIEQYEDLSSIDLPAVLAWVRKKLTKKLDEYRTVFLNDEKVGYFRLCEGGDDSLEIDDLYVLSPYQGQGIGSEIVRHCIEESDRFKKPLMLYVFTQNTGAVHLYEKMGFELKEIVSPTRKILIRRPSAH